MRHAVAICVKDAEVSHSIGISQVNSLLIKRSGFCVILFEIDTPIVHTAKVEHRSRITTIGSFLEKVSSFGIVLFNTLTCIIKYTKVTQGTCIA